MFEAIRKGGAARGLIAVTLARRLSRRPTVHAGVRRRACNRASTVAVWAQRERGGSMGGVPAAADDGPCATGNARQAYVIELRLALHRVLASPMQGLCQGKQRPLNPGNARPLCCLVGYFCGNTNGLLLQRALRQAV
jgi:hypothetical protein